MTCFFEYLKSEQQMQKVGTENEKLKQVLSHKVSKLKRYEMQQSKLLQENDDLKQKLTQYIQSQKKGNKKKF